MMELDDKGLWKSYENCDRKSVKNVYVIYIMVYMIESNRMSRKSYGIAVYGKNYLNEKHPGFVCVCVCNINHIDLYVNI